MLASSMAEEGYEVWWDADLPPHMSYGDVITAKIGAAKAAVVVWSDTAAKSEWVRAEADVARNQKKLIQTVLDDTMPPLPFNQIQCASLGDWNGEANHPGWEKVKQSLVALCGPRTAGETGSVTNAPDLTAAAATPVPTPAPPPAPPPSPPPSPAPTPQPYGAQATSRWPLFAGIAIALFTLLIAVTVVLFVVLERDAAEPAPPVEEQVAIPDADPDAEEPVTEASVPEPTPEPVPDRREWIFATVEDSDGFSNVRARPTTRSEIVGTVREGETFSTWRQDGSWWQVELSDGTRGFIYRRLIRLLGSSTAQPPGSPSIPVDARGMVIADSSSRYLTPADLSGLNAGALRLARNEIYARRGYRFEDDALRQYFSRFSWYTPRTSEVSLTDIEQANIELIRRAEARLGR